jgi:hypothetical protein
MGFLVLDNVRSSRLNALLERHGQLLVTLVALLMAFAAAHGRSTQYDNIARLAQAMLQGHVWIDWPGDATSDAVLWNGQYYVIEGPIPAILMMPLVLLYHSAANQTALAIILGAISISAAWDLFRRLGAGVHETIWLCAFLYAGTTLWWCSMLGDVWFIEHCAAVAFTMLALRELAAERPRAWVVALFAAAAIGSRSTMLLALPFYAHFLWHGGFVPETSPPDPRLRIARMRSFALTLVPFVAAWVWYNFARWGVWYDIGYTQFYHHDGWGQPTGSPFRLAYFPYEFYSFFFQAPALVEFRQLAQWPIFKVDVHGVALTWSSPALIFAFWARAPRAYLAVMWTTIAVVALPSFLYYLNGWYQYGMRHALDFEPFLLVLMALAARTGIPRWAKGLICWSIAMSIWGVWYWDAFYRTGN